MDFGLSPNKDNASIPGTPQWRFSQCFGDKGDIEDITDADIISAVEFDHTGEFFATGDRGGRIVLFERNEAKKTCEYKFYTEFQSHEPEFDYLKSADIEEKINKIRWLRRQNAAHFLLSTNDKTIKLWKIFEKSVKLVTDCNLRNNLQQQPQQEPHKLAHSDDLHSFESKDLKLPVMAHHDNVVSAAPRRTFAHAHAYHINSISMNSDCETFISSDDLRINLWNLAISDQSFNIVDIKPENMEELTEVITAAEFHPTNCNIFIYSISRGALRLADMRHSALCDVHAKVFREAEDPAAKNFFTEIISSVADVKFTRDGRYVVSRDYMSMKLWDLNMDKQPVKVMPIHNHLTPRFNDLYESDFIFDRFETSLSGDGKSAMTGTYNNFFQIHSLGEAQNSAPLHLQADKSVFKSKKLGSNKSKNSIAIRRPTTELSAQEFQRRILHMSWHPRENTLAVAATNNLFIFSAF